MKKEEATWIVLNGYERRHQANRGSLGEIDCLTVPESRQFWTADIRLRWTIWWHLPTTFSTIKTMASPSTACGLVLVCSLFCKGCLRFAYVLLALCSRCCEKFLLYSVWFIIMIFFPLHDVFPFCMFFLPFAYFRRFRIPRFLEYLTIFQFIFLSHQNHREC